MKRLFLVIIFIGFISFGVRAQIVTTIAGKTVKLHDAYDIAVDNNGTVFFVDYDGLHKINHDGATITLVNRAGLHAGNLILTRSLTIDRSGNIFLVGLYARDNKILKISPKGIISPIPILEKLGGIDNLAIDSKGNIFFTYQSTTIYKIDSKRNVVRLAGDESGDFGPQKSFPGDYHSNDGKKALEARISPNSLVVDDEGNIYFTQSDCGCVAKIDQNGTISIIAGFGLKSKIKSISPLGAPIDGNYRIVGPNDPNFDPVSERDAANELLYYPSNISVDSKKNVYFIENFFGLGYVQKINAEGKINTIAGEYYSLTDPTINGSPDGITADKAAIAGYAYATDPKGNIYFVEGKRIRKIIFEGLPVPKPTCPLAETISKLPQLKTEAESEKAKDLALRLIGALSELGKYRDDFLKDPHLINLFPTVYYHITQQDLQRIAKGDFAYPIEHMQELLAFFDAYKFNRDNWNQNKKAEGHWKKHFEDAEERDKNIMDYTNLRAPKTAFDVYEVLTSAIQAHVLNDLPRAIRASYKDRFNINLNEVLLKPDFMLTDETFTTSSDQINLDIFDAAKNSKIWGKFFLNTSFTNFGNYMKTKFVIQDRHAAWEQAFNGSELPTKDASQPPANDDLKREGIKACH